MILQPAENDMNMREYVMAYRSYARRQEDRARGLVLLCCDSETDLTAIVDQRPLEDPRLTDERLGHLAIISAQIDESMRCSLMRQVVRANLLQGIPAIALAEAYGVGLSSVRSAIHRTRSYLKIVQRKPSSRKRKKLA